MLKIACVPRGVRGKEVAARARGGGAPRRAPAAAGAARARRRHIVVYRPRSRSAASCDLSLA